MKQIVFALIVAITITGGVLYWFAKNMGIPAPEPSSSTDAQAPKPSVVSTAPITVITQNLDTPWAIAFLPDNSMLVTERKGTVRLVSREGKFDEAPVATLQNVQEIGEGGLMGIVLHPDFSSNHYVYLYYTYTGSGNNTLNRVVRMIYENSQLSDEQIIVDAIPGAVNHNGGRIKFGPDKSLYIATGDAQDPSQAQDRNSLAGKILRVTDAGKAVPGNPFGTMVYSYGHRNPQGLAWDSNDVLWSTEHGPSGIQSGNDEVNRIEQGKNYGWPTIQGDQTQEGMVVPIVHSGTTSTWAPAGGAVIGSSLFFGGLRGQALYEAKLDGSNSATIKTHFFQEFGRIREVITGPDGMLYITTSNRDGRGSPLTEDDRIIKIDPSKL